MAIDGRNLQILANYCVAAADAMAFTLMRTAYSTFIKETEDFSCQIVTPEGLAFANPRSLGAAWFSGMDYGPVLQLIPDYQEGDICITNDSYAGNVATHSPDIHIWKPVFREGRIVCFVVGHIHNTDVGGAVPASLSRNLSEITQEGIRIPPLKIITNGQLNELVTDILKLNVRAPDQNIGDFNAQIASVNIGERKIHEIIDRFGVDDFIEGMYGLLNYSEAQARNIIRSIPDGEYFYADYADEDAGSSYPCRIAITMRVEDEELVLDYTGSDPQLTSSLNMPTGGRERHPLVLAGITYALSTLDPTVLPNAGTLRPTRAILPEGTVMNCEYPAAVGMRSLTCSVTQIVTLGCFSLAIPNRFPSNSPGVAAVMNVRTVDKLNRTIVASLGPVGGGGGGGPEHDGPDGSGGLSAFFKNTPVEINEAEVPILFNRYGLVPDSAGPGQFRGGLATVMEFRVSAPNTTVTARNRNRSVFASAGACGGGYGARSLFTLNPGTPHEKEYGNADLINCRPGDLVRVIGPGAGGFGPAKTRDPALVLRDVRCGFVSEDGARRDYGVVIRGGKVDAEETARLRAAMCDQPGTDGHFRHCDNRIDFETLWTRERYTLLTAFLAKQPVVWRHYLKTRIFDAVRDGHHMEQSVPSQMAVIFADLESEFPVLGTSSAGVR